MVCDFGQFLTNMRKLTDVIYYTDFYLEIDIEFIFF